MEIFDFSMSRLHNEEHFQFQTGFKELVDQYTPSALGVETLYPNYLRVFGNEEEALNVIRKSEVTKELELSDALRDFTFRGLSDTVIGSLNHFNPEVRRVAERVQIVFDHYGNLTIKPYDEETAAINSLLSDLYGTPEDIATLNISAWVGELHNNNTAFDGLTKTRYTKEAVKTLLRMKQVRTEMDAAYRGLVKRINALIEVQGQEAFTEFVNELNKRIEKNENNLAIRKGRHKKLSETEALKS